MSVSIAVIGECMLELTHVEQASREGARPMSLGYGGDTLNTSIYLARNQISVSYVTALGDDIMSDWLLEEWTSEGIDCSRVQQEKGAAPGMYMVNVAEDGERSFLYWRKGSPASKMFADVQRATQIFASLQEFDYLYLSGISLAILDAASLARVFDYLELYRANGGKIAFDGNYRPNLWNSVAEAQQAYTTMYRMSDLALPTLEDEAMLFGYENAEQVAEAISAWGVPEIVVKMGGDGCLCLSNNEQNYVEAEKVIPVDTTAAGDSFNAGYLAARFKGASPSEACCSGHALASQVIQHRGAIMPMDPNTDG